MWIGDDCAIAHMHRLGTWRDSGIDNLEQELGERLDIERDEEKSSSLSVIAYLWRLCRSLEDASLQFRVERRREYNSQRSRSYYLTTI